MADDPGAEATMLPPADETPAAELDLGSGAVDDECAVEKEGSEGAGAAQKCGCSSSDAGEKRGAPSDGSPEAQKVQETEGDDSENLNSQLRENEQAIRQEMNVERTDIDEKDREPKLTAGKDKQAREIEGCACGRRYYSRSEMEELRLLDAGEQRRRWKGVYEGLGSVIAQEYDGLRASQHQKQRRKKKEATTIMGEVSVKSIQTGLGAQITDLFYADALVGHDNGEVIEELSGEFNIINDGDDSSDDEHVSIQRPAFLVDGEPDFESGPPLDGLEYLRRVRWEAAQIPKVKVAKLNSSKLCSEQTPYMPNIPEITECPPNLLPSKHWESAFLAEFSEIRQAFSRLESLCDESRLTKCSENPSNQSDNTQQPNKTPSMTVMLGMDAVSRAATLRKYVRTLETTSAASRNDCMWLFALCAAVDTPLDGETSAALRGLLRKCSSLLAGKSEPDDEVAMLIVLTTIAGKYFGQSEK